MNIDRIVDIGWGICRMLGQPTVLLWLEEEGWQSAHQISLVGTDGPRAHLRTTKWREAYMFPVWSGLN